jgi:hypothetical protein
MWVCTGRKPAACVGRRGEQGREQDGKDGSEGETHVDGDWMSGAVCRGSSLWMESKGSAVSKVEVGYIRATHSLCRRGIPRKGLHGLLWTLHMGHCSSWTCTGWYLYM